MSTQPQAGHYFTDPKTGDLVWVGPTGAEMAEWKRRADGAASLLRSALEAPLTPTQMRDCMLRALRALEGK